MKDKYRVKNDIIKYLLVLVPIFMFIFVYNYLTPLYADDYSYSFVFGENGKRVSSLFDIISSQYSHYFSMNGRVITHSIAQLFLYIGKPIFNVVNSFSFISLGLLIYYHAFLSLRRIKVFPLLFVFFALFFVTPDFGQSFLWITGSSNYLYGPIITLIFLIPFRKKYMFLKELSISKSVLISIGMFALGLLAGNVNENNGVVAVVAAFAFIVWSLLKHKRVCVWSVFGLIGSTIGCILMLFSPGTKKD